MRAPAFGVALLVACGGAGTPPAEVPIWERPGLEGQIRPEAGPPQPGDPAPDFELPRSDGRGTFRLSSARGSWVLLHFTATWCPFCDEEVEHLGRIAAARRDVKVLLVAIQEPPEHWHQYLAGFHLGDALVALEDQDGAAARRWAPPHVAPSFRDRSQVVLAASMLVDPAGKVRLFCLADSTRFDPTLSAIVGELDRLRGAHPSPRAVARSAAPAAAPATLAPEEVVRITTEPVPALAPGASGEVSVQLAIADGYHVMSNQPSRPELIATEVRVSPAEGVTVEPARFPPAGSFRLVDDDIATFVGTVTVQVPVRVGADVPAGPHPLAAVVRYQACTSGSCLFPVDRPITIPLVVAPAR